MLCISLLKVAQWYVIGSYHWVWYNVYPTILFDFLYLSILEQPEKEMDKIDYM